RPEVPVLPAAQQVGFDLIHQLNQTSAEHFPNDPELQARLQSYELAFRMQTSLPEVLNLQDETAETLNLYGINNPVTQEFGRQCLVARRLVERDVRFVQIQHGGGGAGAWDAHGDLRGNHAANAAKVDQPTGALLVDLKR